MDFGTIDAVFQIGSTKSVTRLRQRAGRANHRPGENPTIFLVPTYSLEEFEFKALKNLLGRNELDPINMIPQQPLDVAVQFVVTRACARTKKSQLLTEIESSGYYQSIDNKFFETLMNLVVNGGNSLARYEQFKHVQIKGDMISIASKRHAMRHRFIIGTIEGGQNYRVRQGRRSIGSIEESFAAKLQPGDKFQLGGKFYVVDSIYNTELKVRRSKSSDGFVPRWSGSRLRQSDIIAAELRRVISTTNISDNYL